MQGRNTGSLSSMKDRNICFMTCALHVLTFALFALLDMFLLPFLLCMPSMNFSELCFRPGQEQQAIYECVWFPAFLLPWLEN